MADEKKAAKPEPRQEELYEAPVRNLTREQIAEVAGEERAREMVK